MSEQYWGCSDKMSEANFSPAETLACLVTWHRLENVQLKQTPNHIRNAVKYCVKACYLNGKIHNGSE